jgi:hypothetical protein
MARGKFNPFTKMVIVTGISIDILKKIESRLCGIKATTPPAQRPQTHKDIIDCVTYSPFRSMIRAYITPQIRAVIMTLAKKMFLFSFS